MFQKKKRINTVDKICKDNGFNSKSEVEELLKMYQGELNLIYKRDKIEFLDTILSAKIIKNEKQNSDL